MSTDAVPYAKDELELNQWRGSLDEFLRASATAAELAVYREKYVTRTSLDAVSAKVTSLKAELAAEVAHREALESELRTERQKLYDTAKERDALKAGLYKAYTYGFVQGRDYEAMDTLEAMRSVGLFDDRRDAFIAALAATERES